MSENNIVSNVEALTHRVYFRKQGIEPVLITAEDADALEQARGNPDYEKSSVVEIGGISCELRDISMVERLTQKLIRRGWYRCENEKCSNENRQHRAGERCDYDLTGKCTDCTKSVTERSRQYSLAKFGKVQCHDCSPFGKADELFPGEPTIELSRMRGVAAYYISKGLTDEEVIEAVNRDLTKSSIGRSVNIKPKV